MIPGATANTKRGTVAHLGNPGCCAHIHMGTLSTGHLEGVALRGCGLIQRTMNSEEVSVAHALGGAHGLNVELLRGFRWEEGVVADDRHAVRL